ncbi:urea ABC transporter permease subunit UrtC [Polymorphobacter glacialis]|uniref:Urea ABC transporter permease subunit UrtC n=1 Tax=Sandarakinorhabdus glacialis TaxID=1614636 RepID=A0A916ZP40_9SPHN|nr:urea ABC transporter permease subunit UrtC [Polymorphobacter glacialis]GGE07256.1 urea ABC transporter permease subunit UrtC [Polymorphobacter glacialis]
MFRLKRQFVVAAGVAGVAAFAPFVLGGYDLNLLARFLALSLLALGIVLTWGHGGILSLGQGVFFGLGGYALAMHMKLTPLAPGEVPDFMMLGGLEALPAWWVPFGNPGFALLAVVLVPGIVAALFAWSVFGRRVGGTYFALITQALALAFATLLVSAQETTGGFNGLTDFQVVLGLDLNGAEAGRTLYWVTLLVLALGWAGVAALLASRFGTMLRAVRDGENRVRFLGHDAAAYKIIAFAVAAMLAGAAGALFTLHAGVISPAMVGVVPSIEMVIWVAIGGRTSLAGAIAGTLAVNFARDAISSAFPDLRPYALGLLFILVVTLLPGGLAELLAARFRKVAR